MEFFEVLDVQSIRKITISNLRKKNAMNRYAYVALAQLLNAAGSDDRIKCVVLTGKGDFYSSGNDLSPVDDRPDDPQNMFESDIQAPVKALIAAFINFPKLLVCLVNGPAIGIAATTLALADIVYCHENAYIYTPFTALGICAEGASSYLFPLILGTSKANEMLSLNHKLSAQEALRFNLCAHVYKDESEIWDRLEQIHELPLGSILANKRLARGPQIKMLEKANDEELKELLKRFETDEAMEAMIKFQMRRKSKL